jgi:hypothetical protein
VRSTQESMEQFNSHRQAIVIVIVKPHRIALCAFNYIEMSYCFSFSRGLVVGIDTYDFLLGRLGCKSLTKTYLAAQY